MHKLNIKNLSINDLSALVSGIGEKRHRHTQILGWLYRKCASNFSEMTNLPKELRKTLDEMFVISELETVDIVRSTGDGSQKFLMRCDDGSFIEAVLMESYGHQTICISSQVGCGLGCSFCRTGSGGFVRNLRSDEILDQVIAFKSGHLEMGRRFNIVLMGMGEPLLNTENVTRAIEILNSEHAFALGEKRITLSTIGFPGRITDLTGSSLKFGLAVSLNATTGEIRKKLMPASGDLYETLNAAEHFALKRKTRVTLEYVLISDVNDRDEDARRLVSLTAGRPFKINLIPLNEWSGCGFERPSEERIERFIRLLLPRAPAVTVRRSRGTDISAACGQLSVSGKDRTGGGNPRS